MTGGAPVEAAGWGIEVAEDHIAQAAEMLAEARRNRQWIEGLPKAPASVAEAHAIQDRVAALLGQPVGAFKANAPPGAEPTRGLIFAPMIRPSPARFAVAEVPHLGVEAEIAFRFTRDLPASATPCDRDTLRAAVTAMPAIEIVSGRFRDPRTRPPLEQLADSIANGGLVLGPEIRDWSRLDLPQLHVTLLVNGAPIVQQQGGHPIGDPLGVALALVDMMRQDRGVQAGQVVTTGSWTGLRFLAPGDRCTARFEGLGEAEVTFGSAAAG